MPLPKGYTLDKPVNLPPGYTLDPPEVPTPRDSYITPADVGTAALGLVKGIGSGVFRTGLGVSKLIGAVPPSTTMSDIGMESTTLPEKIGEGAEQVGEFFLPGTLGLNKVSAAMRVPQTSSFLLRAISALGRGGLEAGSAAGVTALQGGDKGQIKTNAAIAGGLTGLGALLEKPLVSLAKSMESSAVKAPNYTGWSAAGRRGSRNAIAGGTSLGFTPDNVFKYDVGGNLKQTAQKTADAIDSRLGELDSILQTGSNKGAQVNLHDVIDTARGNLLGSPQARADNAHLLPGITKALDKWDAAAQVIAPRGGIVDLSIANRFKRAVGHVGSWAYGARDADPMAEEAVANALYTPLRQAIESGAGTAGPRVQQLNKEISELVPIEQAVVRRLPIAARQNLISLPTLVSMVPAMVTGNSRELAVTAGVLASHSPWLANIMQKVAPLGTGTTGRLAAGAISQVGAPPPETF